MLDVPLLPRVLRDDLDEPFRLVDLLELERLRADRLLLEDPVFCAIFFVLLLASMPVAQVAPTVQIGYPIRSVF